MKLFKNRHGHDEIERKWMRDYGSIHALKHINNLSEKQRPVFEELEDRTTEFEDEFYKHKNDTAHYDTYDLVILVGKWIAAIILFVAGTYPLWKHYMK